MMQEVYSFSVRMGQDSKVAYVVGTGTAGTGMATILDILSVGMGIIATSCGLVLTIVLIRNHLKMGKLQRKYERLKIRRIENDLAKDGVPPGE